MMMTTAPEEPTTLAALFGDEEEGDKAELAVDDICRRWAAWNRTRRYIGPPPLAAGILGKLTAKGTGARRGGIPDVALSAELSALNPPSPPSRWTARGRFRAALCTRCRR